MTEGITWSADDPLARIKGESKKANAALRDYARLGAGRSLSILRQGYLDQAVTGQIPPTRHLTTLKNWSSRYSWVARVDAWDRLEQENEDQKWRDRREQWREELFDLSATRGGRTIRTLLDFPLVEETVTDVDEDGRPLAITIEPTKWNLLHVARLLAEVTKSAALALGDVTERSEQKHTGALVVAKPDDLEDDELTDQLLQNIIRLATPGPGEFLEPNWSQGKKEEPIGNGSAPG